MGESKEETRLFPLKKSLKSPIPDAFGGVIVNLVEKASVQELIDYWMEERDRIGLPSKPPTAQVLPEALDETRKLIETTDLAEKVERLKKMSGGRG